MVENKAKNIIQNLDGVIDVQKLTKQDIVKLIDIESNIDNELIPVINEGMKECFRQDVSFVIFKKGFRLPPSPTVLLTNYDGQILGHEILTREDREKYKNDENAFFLGNDFVLFRNMRGINKYPGKECFILPPIDFPELKTLNEINTVVSSSPSTQSDEYLKEKYGFIEDGTIATLIVSFSY